MEIERKFLIEKEKIPFAPEKYTCRHIEQGYLCTAPVVRIRQDNDDFFLTYKSKGLMVREEYNLPLTKEAYCHLKEKTDGRLIIKERYVIPLSEGYSFKLGCKCDSDTVTDLPQYSELNIELDFFKEALEGLVLAEVEFPDEETANRFNPPVWFGEDVTYSSKYHNSSLSLA